MKTVITTIFGSRLYGTETPTSDTDFKSVYLPTGEDIILQRVKESISVSHRSKAQFEKNQATDVDHESYSLQKFLDLLAEGQTVAIDTFFSPPKMWVSEPSPEWYQILENKDRLISRKSSSFIGYCRDQAANYGERGRRVEAVRTAIDLLDQLIEKNGTTSKLGEFEDQIEVECARPYESIVEITQKSGVVIKHWMVCDKLYAFTVNIKAVRDQLVGRFKQYGERAKQADSNHGIDWKAMSHSVRIGQQGLELLNTGKVTLPLPNAEFIRSIKLGKVPYNEVSDLIEQILAEIIVAEKTTKLPERSDEEWIKNFVLDAYRRQIALG